MKPKAIAGPSEPEIQLRREDARSVDTPTAQQHVTNARALTGCGMDDRPVADI